MKNKPIHTNPAKGRFFSLSYDVTYTFHQVLFLLSSSAPFQPKKRQQTLMLHPPLGKEQSCMEPQKKINEKKYLLLQTQSRYNTHLMYLLVFQMPSQQL